MTPLTKRPGIRPLALPARAVATSLPAATLSGVRADTALLPSTAPALRAKSTAAIAVPDRATTRATIATTIAGDGVLRRIGTPPCKGRGTAPAARARHGTPRRPRMQYASMGAKPSGPRPSLVGWHV